MRSRTPWLEASRPSVVQAVLCLLTMSDVILSPRSRMRKDKGDATVADAFSIHQTERWFSFFRFRIRRPRVVLR